MGCLHQPTRVNASICASGIMWPNSQFSTQLVRVDRSCDLHTTGLKLNWTILSITARVTVWHDCTAWKQDVPSNEAKHDLAAAYLCWWRRSPLFPVIAMLGMTLREERVAHKYKLRWRAFGYLTRRQPQKGFKPCTFGLVSEHSITWIIAVWCLNWCQGAPHVYRSMNVCVRDWESKFQIPIVVIVGVVEA